MLAAALVRGIVLRGFRAADIALEAIGRLSALFAGVHIFYCTDGVVMRQVV